MPKKRMKYPVKKGKDSAQMPQLVAPMNALDEETAKILHANQEVILDHLIAFSELALSIKKDMRKIIKEEVTKQFDARKMEFEGLYRDINLLRILLMEKGQISREELDEKYRKLKEKK